uniref:Cytochrome c oxidase subunit 3 n=1 Tax=Cyrtarachne nagasakiensis TaxID=386110 RepID=A0A0U2KST4_9ARAC|nr:cytochrome c oxidase subunit III [Cyrtarachne nagasakiensis]ALF36379.1 cytochrome c oxidase subunit III [Cyrtarachne nagasakiensis]
MEKTYHSYHIVTVSPWPLLMGFSLLSGVIGMVKMFMFTHIKFIINVIYYLSFCVYWLMTGCSSWKNISSVSFKKCINSVNNWNNFIYCKSNFLFLSFFWAFFHSSLNPTLELGVVWPPEGIKAFSPFQVPLLNTVILLASGVSVTWAHQSILNENWKMGKYSLMMTWVLGLYFLSLQGIEYYMAEFSISDSVFGSVFFMATGFHGFHVIVGSLFLFIMWLRLNKMHFSSSHHFGFECAAWYWHFVDVVWLFLFSVVYWWGT